jgi:aromatic-L-amino-acid decarboxylase
MACDPTDRGGPFAVTDDEAELERLNASVLERVNAGGEVFISHTKLKGRYCLRPAIGNLQRNETRVRRAYQLICRTAGIA